MAAVLRVESNAGMTAIWLLPQPDAAEASETELREVVARWSEAVR
jgi:hypothetical protein